MSPSLEPGLLQNPELLETPMSSYYFVAASEAFLTQEEPLEKCCASAYVITAKKAKRSTSGW